MGSRMGWGLFRGCGSGSAVLESPVRAGRAWDAGAWEKAGRRGSAGPRTLSPYPGCSSGDSWLRAAAVESGVTCASQQVLLSTDQLVTSLDLSPAAQHVETCGALGQILWLNSESGERTSVFPSLAPKASLSLPELHWLPWPTAGQVVPRPLTLRQPNNSPPPIPFGLCISPLPVPGCRFLTSSQRGLSTPL